MVSGFLISLSDHDRIFSGLAIEIRIWSKTWAGVVGLKRFIISWFIVFSSRAGRRRQQIRKSSTQAPCPASGSARNARPLPAGHENVEAYSAASEVGAGPILELCRSTL